MISSRLQDTSKLRVARRTMAVEATGDPEAADKMAKYVAVQTAKTELERSGLCDDCWVQIDSETDWPMHKKLAVLKYFWRVTSTLEWTALHRFDASTIRELTAGAGDGYDRHMARNSESRRGRGTGRVSNRDFKDAVVQV